MIGLNLSLLQIIVYLLHFRSTCKNDFMYYRQLCVLPKYVWYSFICYFYGLPYALTNTSRDITGACSIIAVSCSSSGRELEHAFRRWTRVQSSCMTLGPVSQGTDSIGSCSSQKVVCGANSGQMVRSLHRANGLLQWPTARRHTLVVL